MASLLQKLCVLVENVWGRPRLRSASTAGDVSTVHLPIVSPTDVNQLAKFCILWANSMEQCANCSARQQHLAEHVWTTAENLSLFYIHTMQVNIIHQLWRFCDSGPSMSRRLAYSVSDNFCCSRPNFSVQLPLIWLQIFIAERILQVFA